LPRDSLVKVGSSLFGMTEQTINLTSGTLFRFDLPTQTATKLFQFAAPPTGLSPRGSLILSDGLLYGMTQYGGANDGGTIFSFPVPEPGVGIALLVGAAALGGRGTRRNR
jgi:uncharacterized repeat protein (TIGR03803 family)